MTDDGKNVRPPPVPGTREDSVSSERLLRTTPPATPGADRHASRKPPPVPQRKTRETPPLRAAPRSRPRPGAEPSEPYIASTKDEPLDDPTLAFNRHSADDVDPHTPLIEQVEAERLTETDDLMSSLRSFMEQELGHIEPENHRGRAVLLHELGHLEELVSGDGDLARTRAVEAHQEDATFIPSIRDLRRYYAGQGDWRSALKAMEAEARATADEERRAALLCQMGELLNNRLSDTEGAIEHLRAAISLCPQDRRAPEILRNIYYRLEEWPELLSVLRGISNVTADGAERARLLVEMAEICEFRLDRSGDAQELYAQALSLNPDSEATAIALRRLYLAHERWKDLRDLLAKEAGRDHEPDERFADLYRAARISEVYLQDDVYAASLLETAAALRPGDPLPLMALISIDRRTGRHEELATAISRLLRLVRDSADRASLFYQLGKVQEDWLERPEAAVKSYHDALKEEPGHEASLRALANLHKQFENWEELLDLELLRAERSKDIARRADGYVLAAQIAEGKLKDIRRAVDLYDRAYRMVQGLPEAFRSLERIYRGAGKWESLAELCEQEAEITHDKAMTISLLRTAARLHEEALGNREVAITTLEKIQQQSPEDRQTLIHLARLYEEAGRMEDLRQALQRWASMTEDGQEKTELSRRLGELLEGPLRRTEQAVDVYREILQQMPTDRPTIERLKAIFERTGRWSDLVDILRQELEVTQTGIDDAPLWIQIGQICRDKLGDFEQSQAAFQSALQSDPRSTPAMLAQQEMLRQRGQWDQLVELMESTAERIREPVRAAATLYSAGEVCEGQLGDSAKAEQFYNRAVELDPGNGPARHGLERLYLASQDRNALEAHYLREAEVTSNPLLRLRAYLRLGALFNGPGNDSVGATAAYESALRVVEDQPDALRSLAVLLRRTMSWERLARLLAKIAGSSTDRGAAVAALKEWAAIVEVHLSDKWDPVSIFERILDGFPADDRALFALDRLAHERGDTSTLVSLSIRQVKAGGDGSWLASLCMRAAILLLSQGDLSSAAKILRQGLKANPDYLPLIQLLRGVDEHLEEWREAGELLMREGSLASCPEVARAALLRAGNILLDRFGDVQRARAAFDRVFSEDPGNAAAFGRLAAILSSNEEWHALVAAYQRRMDVLDPHARMTLLMELASLYRDSLHNVTDAIAVLQQVLSIDPNHRKALLEISEMCGIQHRWRDAEEHLARLAKAVADDPRALHDALLQRASILEEQLGEDEAALLVLQDLLDQFPGDRDGLVQSLTIFRRRGNWQETVEILEEMSSGGTADEKVDTLVDMAELFSRTLDDPDAAGDALRRAASTCVDSTGGVERIIDYFERRGDFDGLVALLGQALEGLPPEGAPGSVTVRLARARILAGRLLQPGEAEIEIRKALQSDHKSIPARLELAGLHLWGDNLGEATAEYQRVLDLDPFCLEAFRGLYRVHDRRGDEERAAGAAQAVVAVAGTDVPERKIASQATAPMEAGLSSALASPLGVHDFWNLLGHPDEPKTARELLHLLADYLPTIFSHEVDLAGGGSIIPLSSDDPLSMRCHQLAQVMGVIRMECCLGQDRSSFVAAVPGNPPRLVVDDGFASRAAAGEFRFALGRALAEILTQSLYLSVIQPRSIELMLAAVVSYFERGYGQHLNQAREVDDLAKTISRAIPRKLRKALEEPARAYAMGKPANPKSWLVAARRSAERAGLLLSGDVEASLKVLNSEQASRNVQAELLRFTVGPHLYEARRRLGLSI